MCSIYKIIHILKMIKLPKNVDADSPHNNGYLRIVAVGK